MVKDLTELGAEVNVIRGDVAEVSVVEKAVAAIDGEIGGVVQAAMGLDVRHLCHILSSCNFIPTRLSMLESNLDIHVQPIVAYLRTF